MNITGISYKFIMFNLTSDHVFDAEIPFTGDETVLTKITRSSYESKVEKFKLSKEAIGQYLALIDKYNITEWIGKTPSEPEVYKDEGLHQASFMTLNFDDGSTVDITFRENEETGIEASEEFRKLFFSLTNKDNLISDEMVYPSLKECRAMHEIHGPVVAVKTSHYTSGMMYNSNVTTTKKIEKIEGKRGTVLVTITRKAGDLPEETDSKEIESDIFEKIQEISDKENLACWHYACIDPSIPVDRSMIPLDFSSNFSFSVFYDDSLITGCPSVMRTIGESACKLGGSEVSDAVCELINECVNASGAKIESPTVNPYIAAAYKNGEIPSQNAFIGLGMAMGTTPPVPDTSAGSSTLNPDGTWGCSCGTKGLTGKFCSECGSPRPTA